MRKIKSAASCPGLKFPKPGNGTISVSEYRNLVETESSLQRSCDNFLMDYPDVKIIRLPDRLWRIVYSIRSPALQAILGQAVGGMPDLLMFKRTAGKYNSCLAIELKVKGRPLRQNQKKWASVLHVFKIESFEDFEREFTEWYRGRPFANEEEE